ncbi:MAG: elongation factor P [Spirochaetales bacterium]
MLTASELKVGTVFKVGTEVLVVQKLEGTKTGRNMSVTQLRVKNLLTNVTAAAAYRLSDNFEEILLDNKKMNFQYATGDTFNFMDNESYEQSEIEREELGDAPNYMAEGMDVEIVFYEGKPVTVKLPILVDRQVVYCEPGIKGDTSGRSLKPAKLDTGFEIMIPIFVDQGEWVRVDTRDGSYKERVKVTK